MSEVKNPRVHAEILPALAAVVAPTNKILAIGSVTAKGTPDAIAPVLPFEVRATVRNYLAGKIDQHRAVFVYQIDSYHYWQISSAETTSPMGSSGRTSPSTACLARRSASATVTGSAALCSK